jgi:hypothetical protein
MKRDRRSQTGKGEDSTNELLRDLLITQLGIAGVPQLTIREIVGCDVYRVSRIVKHLKTKKKD